MSRSDMIHEFWFGALDDRGQVALEYSRRWFAADPAFDREVRIHFESDVRAAAAGRRVRWQEEPRGALALVLLFDQFPRNIYRGTPRALLFDGHARQCMRQAIARGWDGRLWPVERAFLYMPLQHSEAIAAQDEAVERFTRLAEETDSGERALLDDFLRHAREHREIIRTFGRFPQRNAMLERESTAAERAFLNKGGARWGRAGE